MARTRIKILHMIANLCIIAIITERGQEGRKKLSRIPPRTQIDPAEFAERRRKAAARASEEGLTGLLVCGRGGGAVDRYGDVAYLTDHFHEAPVWIVACLNDGQGTPSRSSGASIYPAVQNMLLAARALGLGATLTLMLVALGSLVVGLVFTLFGAGTLAMGRARR